MTPNEPDYSPSPAPRREPFWSYQDVLVFAGMAFPSLFVAAFLVRIVRPLVARFGKGFEELLVQLFWYALIFGVLYLLLKTRYNAPFWRSLGWGPPYRSVNWAFAGGPVLALGIGYLGYVIHTPDIPLPFDQMLANLPTKVLFGIFAVILGPLCEELAFRGFLMPLLMRSAGAVLGILLTALLFGAMHAPEYGRSWKHVLLITTAGVIFGWVRYRTGSTAASTFMHSGYNLMQFAAFLAQTKVS